MAFPLPNPVVAGGTGHDDAHNTMHGAFNTTVAFKPVTADAIWYVSTAGSDSANDGRSRGSAFRTVQHAQDVAAAAGGGKVKVGTGVFAPPASVSSNVTIQGGGWVTVFSTSVTTFTNITQFAASSSGQKIRDVTYANTAVGGSDGPVGIHTNGSTGYEISGLQVTGPFHQGVLAYHGKGTLRACTFSSIGVAALGSTPGDAISIFGGYLLFSECLFLNCLQDAAYYATGSSGTGHDCISTGSPEGFQVRDSCTSIQLHDWVIEIVASTTVTSFAGTVQLGCSAIGIHHNNAISLGSNVPLYGFGVQNSNVRVSVTDNDIAGNFRDGVLVQTTGAAGTESTDCAVHGNGIYGATRHAVFVATNETAGVSYNRSIGAGAESFYLIGPDALVMGNRARNSVGDGYRIAGNNLIVVANRAKNGSANGMFITGQHCPFTSNICTANAQMGMQESGSADFNGFLNNDTTGNLHGTTDILVTGANSHLPLHMNYGRYTAQVGA